MELPLPPAPPLTREEVRRVDALAISELGIPGPVLMENAGRNAAAEILARMEPRDGALPRVAVLCGAGNNGGDGYVIARHLANRGVPVELFTSVEEERQSGDSGVFRRVARSMGLPVHDLASSGAMARVLESDLVVDALLGTGFCGDVREPLAGWIAALDGRDPASVVAVDVPSGFDADTGRRTDVQAGKATVRAGLTITFVAPKVGFSTPGAEEWCGEVVVVDIGVPPSLVERVRSESSGDRSGP